MPESYTGDEGDDALAAGYDKMDGLEEADDLDLAVNKTRDYVAALKNLFNNGFWPWARISGTPTTYPPSSHSHSRLQVSSIKYFRWSEGPNEWNTNNNMYVAGYLRVIGAIYNPSTKRVKKNIVPAPAQTGLFPEFKEYERTDVPGPRELGYLAEDLVGTDAERFVKFDQDGNPEAIAYLALAVAQIAQLQQRVAELEGSP